MEEEVILNKIIEDAQNEADAVIIEAQDRAKKIEEENTNRVVNQMRSQFEIMKKKVISEASTEVEKAEFEARNAELTEKKRIIDIVKEKVKEKIRGLDEETYTNLIDEKIKRYKNSEAVEIVLPKKCYDKIKKIATGYGMKVLEVSDELDIGVIVRCGNLEYNYDFEENMEIMSDEIEKDIDTILFS